MKSWFTTEDGWAVWIGLLVDRSFPGSAWERAAGQALPVVRRSKAEPLALGHRSQALRKRMHCVLPQWKAGGA